MKTLEQLIQEDPNLDQEFRTAIAMSDALFRDRRPRKQSPAELIYDAILVANRLDMLLLELAKTDPMDANIEEAQDFAQGILDNLKAYRKKMQKPYVPHEVGCKCDDCVAARSDETFDRKRDGTEGG